MLEVRPALMDSQLGGAVSLLGSALVPRVRLDFDKPANSNMSEPVVTAFLTNDAGRVELADVTWLNDTEVIAVLTNPAQLGTWDVHLIEPRGRELVLPSALQVVDCGEVDCPLPDGGLITPGDGGVVTCGTMNFRDRDLDGFGSGTATNRCGPGYVSVGGDCDDRDRLTNPGALEVCNGLDDNCNGAIDEGQCSDAGWSAFTGLQAATNDFVSASSYAPGALWVVGGPRVFLRRDETGFIDVSSSCPGNLAAVWAEPSGNAEVAGGDGGVGQVATGGFTGVACTAERVVAAPLVAMTGFVVSGVVQYAGVTANGQLYRWARGTEPMAMATTNLTSRDTVFDVHGVTPEQLYAVGVTQNGNGGGQGNRRLAVWALQADGSWRAESLTEVDGTTGTLRGLWVLSSSEAFAVGDNGTVLRKSGGVWRRLDTGTAADVTSVRAFSVGRAYVSQADGRVRRWAQSTWQTVFRNDAGVRFNDITGTSEEDLWAVGLDGVIGRGPR